MVYQKTKVNVAAFAIRAHVLLLLCSCVLLASASSHLSPQLQLVRLTVQSTEMSTEYGVAGQNLGVVYMFMIDAYEEQVVEKRPWVLPWDGSKAPARHSFIF